MNAGKWPLKGWTMLLGGLLLAGCGGGGSDTERSYPWPNDAPVLSAVGDRTARTGETLSFTVSAADTDGDSLTFSAEGLPAGASFDPASRTFTWTPAESDAGIHYLAFAVADFMGSDSEAIAITVRPGAIGTPVDFRGTTVFGQSIPTGDLDSDIFPGQANFWDLGADFSLLNGGDDQFEGAMALSLGPIANETPHPAVFFGDLAWSPPFLTQEDGVKTVAVGAPDLLGSFSALLNGTSDSRLQQTVDLSAVQAGTPLTLSWVDEDFLVPGNFETDPETSVGDTVRFELVITDLGGGTPTRIDLSGEGQTTADLSRFAGRRIQISFEARHTNYGLVAIDDVSLTDNAGRQFVVNGNFEKGDLRGWKTPLLLESQNVTTKAPATTEDEVAVTRSFYTHPLRKWGRWVDIFENTGTTATSLTIRYRTTLGAKLDDGTGVARIYETPDAAGALSVWDARELLKKTGVVPAEARGSRDVGFVFGNLTPDYISLTSAAAPDGEPEIVLEKTLTLGPDQRIALVTFVVMDVVDTGETAGGLSTTAPGVDAVNQAIAAGFWTDPQYREGIPEEVLEIIDNLPRP